MSTGEYCEIIYNYLVQNQILDVFIHDAIKHRNCSPNRVLESEPINLAITWALSTLGTDSWGYHNTQLRRLLTPYRDSGPTYTELLEYLQTVDLVHEYEYW